MTTRAPQLGRSAQGRPVDRRSFLGALGAGAVAMTALDVLAGAGVHGAVEATETGPGTGEARRQAALQIRVDMARLAFDRPLPDHQTNGDEEGFPNRIGNYSKALPHDARGEVEPGAYDALLAALASGEKHRFEAVPLGGARKLTNPQAGLAFDLEGPDSHHLAIRPAPRLDSAEAAAEMAELYWMGLLRDVSLTDFPSDEEVKQAGKDLSRFSDFRGPRRHHGVTPDTIFRGDTAGDLVGPYLSQFLLKDIPYGSLTISQRQQTVLPAVDFMTDYDSWLAVQNGVEPDGGLTDPTPRYIRNMRDLTHYVHVDALYEAYLNACLILLGMNAPLDPGNPYVSSATQIGFGTFGGPHILSLVTEVATRALKAVWYQKWYVHRRLRPEEFGGRVHNLLTGAAAYPVHPELLRSRALDAVFRKHGTYLLPQAFAAGCPTHPSYGAGHATVAGACVTILKAWFDESYAIPDPIVPDRDGTALVPYTGDDAGRITIGGELNKVAANIAMGRNMAGIHYRSDYSESIKLGEAIALGVLEEQQATYHERVGFTLTRFDGTTVTV